MAIILPNTELQVTLDNSKSVNIGTVVIGSIEPGIFEANRAYSSKLIQSMRELDIRVIQGLLDLGSSDAYFKTIKERGMAVPPVKWKEVDTRTLPKGSKDMLSLGKTLVGKHPNDNNPAKIEWGDSNACGNRYVVIDDLLTYHASEQGMHWHRDMELQSGCLAIAESKAITTLFRLIQSVRNT